MKFLSTILIFTTSTWCNLMLPCNREIYSSCDQDHYIAADSTLANLCDLYGCNNFPVKDGDNNHGQNYVHGNGKSNGEEARYFENLPLSNNPINGVNYPDERLQVPIPINTNGYNNLAAINGNNQLGKYGHSNHFETTPSAVDLRGYQAPPINFVNRPLTTSSYNANTKSGHIELQG